MPSLGSALLQHRADLGRSTFEEIFDLMADKKSHQVGEPEATQDFRGVVANPGRSIEGRIELGATDFDSRGAVVGKDPIEPMHRAVERAAEVKQDCVNVPHERLSLPVETTSP